jgi:predicted transcriptional regulator
VTTRNISTHPLTELQQAILDVLWEQGPATAEDVRKALRPKHPLTDSSVRTLLRRLEPRGYVSHRTEGKVFIYKAEIPSQSVAARAVQNIIRRFCAGSVEQFLTGMVDERIVSADELQRLAKKVKARKSDDV